MTDELIYFGTDRTKWLRFVCKRFTHIVECTGDSLEAQRFCEEHFGDPYFVTVPIEIDDSESPTGKVVNDEDFYRKNPKARYDYFADQYRFRDLADATLFKLAGFTDG